MFSVLEYLNTSRRSSTVQEMLQVQESAKRELRHPRSEEMFDEMFEQVAKAAEDGSVHAVEPPRSRRRPARYARKGAPVTFQLKREPIFGVCVFQ